MYMLAEPLLKLLEQLDLTEEHRPPHYLMEGKHNQLH
jgi:hypothetical protein